MYKITAFFLLLFIGIPIMLSAQDSAPDVDEWDDFRTTLYVKGDQSVIISLGTVFPMIFTDNKGNSVKMNFYSPLGGGGNLAYNYYLTPHMFLGTDFGVQFISGVNGDSLFLIPLGARFGYQFNVGKFDIPLSTTIGMSWHRYKGLGYYGLFARGGVAGYYRVTPSWSFGLTTNWYWFPEWTDKSSENMNGHMLDLFLSARYHF